MADAVKQSRTKTVAAAPVITGTPWPRAWKRQQLLGDLEQAHAQQHFPTVLLLAGPRGVGLRALMLDIAQGLICPNSQGLQPCGTCPDCRQFLQGHSRCLWVMPNVSEEVASRIEPYGPDRILQDPWATAAPPASSQIPVGNEDTVPTYPLMTAGVRGLSARLAMSEKHNRVVLLPWAEHLNQNSSNALLKLLEEPPPRVYFILATAAADRVLPTIRSRSSLQTVAPLSTSSVREFLLARDVPATLAQEAAERALGCPGIALQLSSPEQAPLRQRAREWIQICQEGDAEKAFAWIQNADELSSKDRKPILALLETALGELSVQLTHVSSRSGLEQLERLRLQLEQSHRAVVQYSKPQMAFTSCFLALHA